MSRKSRRSRMMGKIVKPIHEEYQCRGYYGFGSGVSLYFSSRRGGGGGNDTACNHCPLREECFEQHKGRVKGLLPALVEEFDMALSEYPGRGDLAAIVFHQRHGVADPYVLVMSGNLEDGILVAGGQRPKDRGDLTLEYPFTGN